MMVDKGFGYARRDIKAGETIALLEIGSGKVTSDVIKFKPWGKKKLAKHAFSLEALR